MGDGQDIAQGAEISEDDGIALQVAESQAERAIIILNANREGVEWCPNCGGTLIDVLPLPWYWVIWSILFLGIAPFSPPTRRCRNCGNQWE